MTDKIETERHGPWGIVTLTREKALNSLDTEMCRAMDDILAAWAKDDAVKAVLVEGAGARAFCAGGDVRWLHDTAKTDPEKAATFFREEYRLDTRIHHFPKPYVTLIDGICMGGGVGISAGASHRVVSDRTLWAMPECMIGLIPDVGASYYLPKLPGGLGLYLALTGVRLTGADCQTAGIADHLVEAKDLPALREGLLALDLAGDAAAAISGAMPTHSPPDAGALVHSLKDIDQHFQSVTDLPSLFSQLEKTGGAFGQGALEKMRPASPTSLALTLRLLKDAPGDFKACITREFDVAAHLMEGPDFLEGVRAQVVDKDRNPSWNPATLEGLDPARLDRYFTPPAGGPLDLSGL